MDLVKLPAFILCTIIFRGCYSTEAAQQIEECRKLPKIGTCCAGDHGGSCWECRERDHCLLEVAEGHNISQLCYEIDSSYKAQCLQTIAINTHNPDLCIQGEGEKGEEYAWCLAEASDYNLWVCDRISNRDVKNICVHEVAYQKMDYVVCSNILNDPYSRAQCQVQIRNRCLKKYFTTFSEVRSSICLNYSKTYEECRKFYPSTWSEVSSFFEEHLSEYNAYCSWANEQCNIEC